MQENHEHYLGLAIRLARDGMDENRGGPFGAVVVKNDEIIGEGKNEVTSTNDPTAHAEIVAIRDACKTLGTFDLSGTTLYASSEPCPMCFGAIYWARPDAVYYAGTHEDAKEAGFDDSFILKELKKSPEEQSIPFTHVSKLHEEARALFSEWKEKEDKTVY